MGLLDWLNAALALIGILVALGAIERMSPQTECTIIAAFITAAAGLAGYALGSLFPTGWEKVFDTLLLGGTVAILIGTRRQTIWVAPKWMPWISLSVSLGAWATFFAGVQ